MMCNVIKCFTGLFLLLIQFEKCISARKCLVVNNDEGRLVANCSFGLVSALEGSDTDPNNPEFPTDLDKNIEILDASGFPAPSLPALREFSRLTELYLRKIYGLLPEGFFQSVPCLKVLDISGASFEGWSGWAPKLAPSIKTLTASSLQSLIPDISDLHNLEYLSFSNNNLKEFPAISSVAPLARLDLSENPLMPVSLLDIAPFCHLKHINLNRTHIQEEITCCEIETWMVKHNILFRLSCGRNVFFDDIDSGVYYEYDDTQPEQEQEVDYERCSRPMTNHAAVRKYDECMGRSSTSLFMTILMIWFATAVVGFAICTMYVAYRSNASRPAAPKNDTADLKLKKAGVKSSPQTESLTPTKI